MLRRGRRPAIGASHLLTVLLSLPTGRNRSWSLSTKTRALYGQCQSPRQVTTGYQPSQRLAPTPSHRGAPARADRSARRTGAGLFSASSPRHQSLLICGPTGTGKSWLACAPRPQGPAATIEPSSIIACQGCSMRWRWHSHVPTVVMQRLLKSLARRRAADPGRLGTLPRSPPEQGRDNPRESSRIVTTAARRS